MKKIQTLMKWISVVCIVFSYLLFLNRTGKFNILYQNRDLESIRHDQGYAYLANIGDSDITIGKLPITLFENDIEIRRNFSDTTQIVREEGAGSFVIWDDGTICFSSTDNSDPLEKTYRIEYPVIIGSRIARYLFAISFILISLYLLINFPVFYKVTRLILRKIWNKKKIFVVGIAAILPFSIVLFRLMIRQPLWADEIFTLLNYCFDKNPFFPATIYNYPNNHILLNLILSIYFRMIQISSFCQIALQPWIARSIPVAFSFFTILFTMLAAGKISSFAGVLAGVILTTTVPFYAWTTQIRGYSPSFLFISILIYIMIAYQEKPDCHWLLPAAALAAALIIYTIPFNGLFVGATAIATFLHSLWSCRKIFHAKLPRRYKFGALIRHPQMNLCFALIFGVFLAIAFYFPVYDQLLDTYLSEGTYSPQSGFSLTVIHNFSELLSSFFSGRVFLFIFLMIGSILLLWYRKFSQKARDPLVLSLFIIVIPFILCGILRYSPFNRNFLPLIPALAFSSALLLSEIIQVFFQIEWIHIRMQKLEAKIKRSNIKFDYFSSHHLGMILTGILFFIGLNISFGLSIVKIHSAMPNADLTRINSLAQPYFLSKKLNSDSFLNSVKKINGQNIPVIIRWPADFYFYHLCDCYQMQCSCDFLGPEGQKIIHSGEPYFLIRTKLNGEKDNSLSGIYHEQCKLFQTPESGAYQLYRCNSQAEDEANP